jgi:hypothetical protein
MMSNRNLTLAFWTVLLLIFGLTIVLIQTQDNADQTMRPQLSIDSRYYEIDNYTGFHYLSKNVSSGFSPRYCLLDNGRRGHLRSSGDQTQCVEISGDN